MLCYRIGVTIVNMLFPPLAVILLTGLGHDTLVNSILFLCAVIPSHIHGFYLSCTYFHRRGKARKGRWPGGPKALIASEDVLNGGLSRKEVERRWCIENGVTRTPSRRNSRARNSGRVDSRRGSVRKSGARQSAGIPMAQVQSPQAQSPQAGYGSGWEQGYSAGYRTGSRRASRI